MMPRLLFLVGVSHDIREVLLGDELSKSVVMTDCGVNALLVINQ